MKALVRIKVSDEWVRDKEMNTIKEKNRKTRWVFGIKVFDKEYDADTEIVDLRKKIGLKA